jgi:NAD(P)H-hydrate epimerase
MARLVGGELVADRIEVARSNAGAWKSVVVLKGAYTVVGQTGGRAAVLPFANPALATAGTGDVLAGAILGLLGQGLAATDAARVGAFVHGLAGEIVRQEIGVAGAIAGDLAARLPQALRAIERTSEGSLSESARAW